MADSGQSHRFGDVDVRSALPSNCGSGRRPEGSFGPNSGLTHCSKKGSRLLCFCPHEPAALQALGRPDCVDIVEFRNRLCAGRQRHPRLLGGRENVNVRRTEIRVVHGTDADEPNGGTGLRVVTPNRNPARRAASNLLTLAARRGRPDEFGLTGRVYDAIGFIESIERMRSASLTLAPTAMASMNNQWRSNQPISDLATCAPAFHVWLHQTAC